MPENKRFRLRPKAEEDLENIYEYSYQEFGRARADQYIEEFDSAEWGEGCCVMRCPAFYRQEKLAAYGQYWYMLSQKTPTGFMNKTAFCPVH